MAVLGAVCGVALMAPGSAMADHSVDLNFIIDETNVSTPTPPPSDAYVFGHIEAGPNACLRDRVFKLYKGSGPKILIDRSRSSANGFFALGGDLSGTDRVVVKMDRKTFGPKGSRHACEADTNTFIF